MPGNIIEINRDEHLKWYIVDSKMGDLIDYLDIHGYREIATTEEKTVDIPQSKEE